MTKSARETHRYRKCSNSHLKPPNASFHPFPELSASYTFTITHISHLPYPFLKDRLFDSVSIHKLIHNLLAPSSFTLPQLSSTYGQRPNSKGNTCVPPSPPRLLHRLQADPARSFSSDYRGPHSARDTTSCRRPTRSSDGRPAISRGFRLFPSAFFLVECLFPAPWFV